VWTQSVQQKCCALPRTCDFHRARILERIQLNNWSRTIKSQSPLIAALTINIVEQTSPVVLRARLFISPFRAIANFDNHRGLMAFHHVVNRTSCILTSANKYFQRDRRISEGKLCQSYPAEFPTHASTNDHVP